MNCSLCIHPSVSQIDVDIHAGLSDGAVARRYGLGRQAVRRHRLNHPSRPPGTPMPAHDPFWVDTQTGTVYPDKNAWLEAIAREFDVDVEDLKRHFREGHHLRRPA